MTDFQRVVVSAETPILDAVEAIDRSGLQIALVVDAAGQLIGTVTDGDVRRALLRGENLKGAVGAIMNRSPKVALASDSREKLLSLMRTTGLHQIPLVDGEGRLVGLQRLDEIAAPRRQDSPVVLMAGGRGTRLHPLTHGTPKPMLPVGGKPILETILENFIEHGFHRFFISLNYMGDRIEAHFGDGARWGVEIGYLRESEYLGTAGALALLPEPPGGPVVVMNGDILTRVNFEHLLEFHRHHRAQLTMCVQDYEMQVPFGVVMVDEHRVARIDEKPAQRFFVNAGIYVIEPGALGRIPAGRVFDMPDLISALNADGAEVAAFPLREYWLDVGHAEDLERARNEFAEHFE